jgi:hypothetical protein
VGDPDGDLADPPDPQDSRHRSWREVSIAYFSVPLVGFALWIAYGIDDF